MFSAVAFAAYQAFSFPEVIDVDFFSLLAEGVIALIGLVSIFVLQNIQANKSIYNYLMSGFTILFIALWTDTLDELFEPPKLLTTILEDSFQVIGFSLIIVGIYTWIKHNNKITQQLHELAKTDSLTGLLNRRYFLEKVNVEIEKSRRYNNGFSILMIDIDHFKSINDNYGHHSGDAVLREFSKVIVGNMRKTDIISRWGGEEFLVLIPESNAESCFNVAEKLRLHIENISVVAEKLVIKFTVSIGIAILKNEDHTSEVLINRADKALYEAKQNGRNCVRVESSENK